MAEYEIQFKHSVWKDLKKVPRNDPIRNLSRVENLGDDPRPMGREKLTGEELYRVRQGNYRIVYSIQDNELTICSKILQVLVSHSGCSVIHKSIGHEAPPHTKGDAALV